MAGGYGSPPCQELATWGRGICTKVMPGALGTFSCSEPLWGAQRGTFSEVTPSLPCKCCGQGDVQSSAPGPIPTGLVTCGLAVYLEWESFCPLSVESIYLLKLANGLCWRSNGSPGPVSSQPDALPSVHNSCLASGW